MSAPATFRGLYKQVDCENNREPRGRQRVLPTRGVVWVLRWAAALAVLFVSSGVLAEFVYLLAAEQTLVRAARAGALEATLPRATLGSISDSVQRRLTRYPALAAGLELVIAQNGITLHERPMLRPGNRLLVTLTARADLALPRWLQTLKFWSDAAPLEVRVERQLPERAMRIR